jgi:hypothetical protein
MACHFQARRIDSVFEILKLEVEKVDPVYEILKAEYRGTHASQACNIQRTTCHGAI